MLSCGHVFNFKTKEKAKTVEKNDSNVEMMKNGGRKKMKVNKENKAGVS